MDTYGETYGSFGFMLISSGWDSRPEYDINAIKSWFQANTIDYAHHFHGNLQSVWLTLGYGGSIPYNVLIDRDRNVRMADNFADGAAWQTCIEEIVGY